MNKIAKKIIISTLVFLLIQACNTTKNVGLVEAKTKLEESKTDTKYVITIDRKYEKKITDTYKTLMSMYAYDHYLIFGYELINPKIIVIHATASYSLKPIIDTFTPDILAGRKDAKKGGNVNLGSHFIVDRDGTIYSIIPTNIMARHTIGFNHTSIGIENIGYPNKLTEKQLEANVKLIKYLEESIKSIEHVIGHQEFNHTYMPHYKLVKQYNKSYKLGDKIDPGIYFMNDLRKLLSN